MIISIIVMQRRHYTALTLDVNNRNADNSQDLFRIPLRFYLEPLMLSSQPRNLKYVKKCFMSYLILKTNSVDYHDGVHFVAMYSETLQKKLFRLLCCVKM